MPTNHRELAAANLQAQVRRNAIEQNEALQDLSAWEKSMKELEDSTDACTVSRITAASQLKNSAKDVSERTAIVSTKSQDIPPALQKSSITIEAQQPVVPMKKAVAKPPPSAILIDVGKSNRNVDDLGLEESAEVKRLEGNALYAKGNFEGAIQCYTKCIQLDPKSVTAFSNRAMSYLKIKEWQKAESDATSAINLNSSHLKSYQRRSVARFSLGKIRFSLQDLHIARAIFLENKRSNREEDTSTNASSATLTLKQIDDDIEKMEAALLKAARRAPKRLIPIRVSESSCDGAAGDSGNNNKIIQHTSLTNNGHHEATPTPTSTPSTIAKSPTYQHRQIIQNIYNARTWMDFQQNWKLLASSPDQKSICLQNIRPRVLAKIYQNGMEDCDILEDLVLTCDTIETAQAQKVLNVLSRIPSVDIVVMMMKPAEKERISSVLMKVSRSLDASEASRLTKAFSVTKECSQC